jgi:hypothetical protein
MATVLRRLLRTMSIQCASVPVWRKYSPPLIIDVIGISATFAFLPTSRPTLDRAVAAAPLQRIAAKPLMSFGPTAGSSQNQVPRSDRSISMWILDHNPRGFADSAQRSAPISAPSSYPTRTPIGGHLHVPDRGLAAGWAPGLAARRAGARNLGVGLSGTWRG